MTAKRDQILDAAVEEFLEYGFAGTNMDRITERAGVSKRTVYKYFESKENLFRTMCDNVRLKYVEQLDIPYQKGRDIRQQLTDLAWAEGRILMSAEVMAMTKLIMSEVMRNPELAQKAQDDADLKQSFYAMMRNAAADGQLELDDPVEAGDIFISMIKHTTFWPVIFGAPVVSQEHMAHVIESAVEMMMRCYAVGYDAKSSSVFAAGA